MRRSATPPLVETTIIMVVLKNTPFFLALGVVEGVEEAFGEEVEEGIDAVVDAIVDVVGAQPSFGAQSVFGGQQ